MPDQVLDLLDGDVLGQQSGDDYDAEGVRRQVGGESGCGEPALEHGSDGSSAREGSGRLRMYAPNYRSAQALQTRVEVSILDGGTWEQLKQEFAGGTKDIWMVRSFYERFLDEYCKPRRRLLAAL